MPVTKDQIRRIELLDELLGTRKWIHKELLARINQILGYNAINRRTLYRDLNFLEKEKGAPLHRSEKGDHLYYYKEKFSLKTVPLNHDDLEVLRRAAAALLHSSESHTIASDMQTIIAKLENRVRQQVNLS